ncbi:MAG TPA: hypothetical protein VFZ25_08310 [Chloroflexota bacterium]|nr:hypothetical protein [Chloroflexota bacterium]
MGRLSYRRPLLITLVIVAVLAIIVRGCSLLRHGEPVVLLDPPVVHSVSGEPGQQLGSLAWLPNPGEIVLTSGSIESNPGATHLDFVAPDGAQMQALVLPQNPSCRLTGTYGPRLLADGRLAYQQSCWMADNSQTMVYDPANRTARRFLPYDLPGRAGAVAFSPDLRLGIVNDGEGLQEQLLWLYPDHSAPANFPFRRAGWPSWSPDGRTIAVDGAPTFSGFAPWQQLLELPRKLYLYSVATGQLRPILDGFIAAGVPAWSPDGRWLIESIVYSENPGDQALILVNVAKGTHCQLVPPEWYGAAVWSPDGQQIAIATSPPDTRVSVGTTGASRRGAPLPNTLYVLDASHLEELATEKCS